MKAILFCKIKHKELFLSTIKADPGLIILKQWDSDLHKQPQCFVELKFTNPYNIFVLGFSFATEIMSTSIPNT